MECTKISLRKQKGIAKLCNTFFILRIYYMERKQKHFRVAYMEVVMEAYNDFFNDDLELKEEEESQKNKKSFDPVFAIIIMQIIVASVLLIAVMVVKNFFPNEGEKLKAFYKEKVMAQTKVELVLEEKTQQDNG